jgi:hypothetical protein
VDNDSENDTLKRVIAGRAYDNNETFQYLSDKSIEAAIKVRKNSSYWQINRMLSKKVAVLKQLKNFERWKAKVRYGSR